MVKIKSIREIRGSKKSQMDQESDETVSVNSESVDPFIAAEDKELKRLEKLLGIGYKGEGAHKRKIVAEKLNKEFADNEGIEGDFGDFLLSLDDLTDGILKSKKKKKVKNTSDEIVESAADSPAEEEVKEHIEHQPEQKTKPSEESAEYYTPCRGEDIYGKTTDSTVASSFGKYVPPAKRALLNQNTSTSFGVTTPLQLVDENSEQVILLKRKINGLMNKLSEQSKDVIVRSLREIVNSNSNLICSHLITNLILSVCCSKTQVLDTLIPVYAAVCAALHNTSKNSDFCGFLVEKLSVLLVESITANRSNPASITPELNKQPLNYLLLLGYLYNIRVVSHVLIADIASFLFGGNIGQSPSPMPDNYIPNELDLELLLLLLSTCGLQLRQDSSETVITILRNTQSVMRSSNEASAPARFRFMLEIITDIKNNKTSLKSYSGNNVSSSNSIPVADVVKAHRKWLGTIKMNMSNQHTSSSGGQLLTMNLFDLMHAEERGRWWKSGASWVGRIQEEKREKVEVVPSNPYGQSKTEKEISVLLSIADRLGFTTQIRKDIYIVLMTSLNVDDAYNRLGKLNLSGKQDREIARVIAECCSCEENFNPYYAELANVFCTTQRNFRLTFQFVFWDYLKGISEQSAESMMKPNKLRVRKCNNMAKLFVDLVNHFQLSMSVLKVIDMEVITECLSKRKSILSSFGGNYSPYDLPVVDSMTFLNNVLVGVLSSSPEGPENESSLLVFERLSTSADGNTVRELLQLFLQKYLVLPPDSSSELRKRVKSTSKLLDSMSVLDLVCEKDADEEDEEESADSMGMSKKKKPKRNGRASERAAMMMI